MYSLVIDGKYARACDASKDIGPSPSYNAELATMPTVLLILTEQGLRSFFRSNLPACVEPRLVFDLLARGHHHSAADRVEGVSGQRRTLYSNIQGLSLRDRR